MEIKKVSRNLNHKYRVMRLLFRRQPCDYNTLSAESGLNNKELLNALSQLIPKRYVKKKMVYIDAPPIVNKDGIKKVKKSKTEYTLTKDGERKLARTEYVFQMYLRWVPSGGNGNEYYDAISELMVKNKYFGRRPPA